MNYPSLPKGMRFVARIDFTRSRKDVVALTILSVASVLIMLPLGLMRQSFSEAVDVFIEQWWLLLCCSGFCLVYIPLHELTHGVLMYALSGVKPKYGLKLPYAYAGSVACFDRRSHAVIALAPLLLWGIVLFILECVLPGEWFWVLYIVQISNVSGSMGDVYTVWRLLHMPSDILVRDTGTLMTIYRPETESETGT